jgi:hypothetical protein
MAMTTMYPGGSRITPVKGCLKIEDRGSDDLKPVNKKVFFDEIMIKEYPIILGDHPAVYVCDLIISEPALFKPHPLTSSLLTFSVTDPPEHRLPLAGSLLMSP